MSSPTENLVAEGVSIWLDDLSRDRIDSGNLSALIATRDVTGVTTNPTIFANAIGGGSTYAQRLEELAKARVSVDNAILKLTTDDVRDAADILRPVFDATDGVDGRVSIEVSPELAYDTEGTIAQAKHIWSTVGRPNVHIKIPATRASLPAITAVLAQGISVNVTLIFSLERYAEVIDAYLAGLEQAHANGIDLRSIHSVASFFISRVDTEVNRQLALLGTDEASQLRSVAGIANARLAYELFQHAFASSRASALASIGARPQRPLWASTGVKDATLPDTLYVSELVASGTVNTMPEATLDATYDHAEIRGGAFSADYEEDHVVFDRLSAAGIDFVNVTQVLENEGVDKFIASWQELQRTVAAALTAAGRGELSSSPSEETLD